MSFVCSNASWKTWTPLPDRFIQLYRQSTSKKTCDASFSSCPVVFSSFVFSVYHTICLILSKHEVSYLAVIYSCPWRRWSISFTLQLTPLGCAKVVISTCCQRNAAASSQQESHKGVTMT